MSWLSILDNVEILPSSVWLNQALIHIIAEFKHFVPPRQAICALISV